MVMLGYNAIIFMTWVAVGADYRDMSSAAALPTRLLLPLGLGMLFIALALRRLGWWRAVITETLKPAARWPLWVLPVAMLALVVANLAGANWTALRSGHVLMLFIACAMVGFNEEIVARGVLLTGLRSSRLSETGVWFWSSLLFGAAHVPNAYFGRTWTAGLLQAVFAFLMGGALYALRRTSGALWLPMALHGLWDFSSLTLQASGGTAAAAVYCQLGTYLLAIAAVPAVLRQRSAA